MSNLSEYVQAAKAGNPQAYEELYKQTYYVVYYTCFNLLKNEQDAMDVTQDVYVTVMNSISSLADDTKFVAWLNRIAVNKCMDFKKKKSPVSMDAEVMEQSAFFEENENFLPEEYVQNQEKRQIVLNIMRTTLTEKEYETIFLYYFSSLQVKEIAEIMGCPEGTVTYRLSAARGKIKNGVLSYEKESGDKLYGFAAIPFLASLFAMELQDVYGVSLANMGIYNLGIQEGMIGTMGKTAGKLAKQKIIAGVVAGVLVVGAAVAGIVISTKNKKEEKNTTEPEYEYEDYYDYEEETTEEIWEDTTEETEEASTEEIITEKTLEVIELKEYTDANDGIDTISGTIKDIAEKEWEATIFLTDEGHIYSYYQNGTGYYICDLGSPSWGLENLDCIAYDMTTDEGTITVIDGNHYYHAEIENYKPVKVIDSVFLEGKTIRTVGIATTSGSSFNVYCDDGSYYTLYADTAGTSEGPFADSENYLINMNDSLADIVVEGLEVIQKVGNIMICTGGTLYVHEPGSTVMEETPVECTKDYVVTRLYDGYDWTCDNYVAITDINEILILEREMDVEIICTLQAPEAEILDLWYNNDVLIVKTSDGYYSCNTQNDTVLVEDELLNALNNEVVDIYDNKVLLDDGYVYSFPEY